VPLNAVMVRHPSVWTTLDCSMSVRGAVVFLKAGPHTINFVSREGATGHHPCPLFTLVILAPHHRDDAGQSSAGLLQDARTVARGDGIPAGGHSQFPVNSLGVGLDMRDPRVAAAGFEGGRERAGGLLLPAAGAKPSLA